MVMRNTTTKQLNIALDLCSIENISALSLKTTAEGADVREIEDLSISAEVYQAQNISATLFLLMHIMETNQM